MTIRVSSLVTVHEISNIEQSAVIEQEYSIETKEKYVEVIDSVELSNDDDGFLQAA